MITTIDFKGIKRTFITDFVSLDKFIREKSNEFYESAIITQELYDRFNVIDYIDIFRVSDDTFVCSGHGSSDSIPTIIAPNVSQWESGGEVWYELHLGEIASKKTLEKLIRTTQEILKENY